MEIWVENTVQYNILRLDVGSFAALCYAARKVKLFKIPKCPRSTRTTFLICHERPSIEQLHFLVIIVQMTVFFVVEKLRYLSAVFNEFSKRYKYRAEIERSKQALVQYSSY